MKKYSSYPHWLVTEWTPDLPDGRIERLYLHWSAHDYTSVFEAYHFCVALDDAQRVVVVQTHDLRENMRDVRANPEAPYAAHTRARNSFAAGLSIMAMEGSTPQDFGSFPLRADLIDGLCRVAAILCRKYAIRPASQSVMTHAEAALADGYFGTGPEQRWDIARLAPAPHPLAPTEGVAVGEMLRGRVLRHF